ncbi:hypothetical protein [Natrinema sp. 1APR25-10V2]|uniref:hypothetical protein n=1 Tax=Natrinema sp. 1APR25-10V2 TaxID=2951081 RepID=UPI002876C22F|nr:hypothetical protein [Natrinema sp. 1APR25-10V2]MDS0477530.1 hypothetical protein [Natrinema sp. 1APR25-10V2]
MSRKRLNRRTFVTAAGTTTALALAGCADSGPGGNESENGTDNQSGNETDGGDETYTLTVTVENAEGPVEGATVTLEEAGMSGAGEDGMGNESGNESDGGMDNESDGGMDNESSNESDGGMGNESGNESGNETTDIGGGQSFPMEDETDENGEVEFEELEDGEYTVMAENEGEQTEDDVEIDGGDEEVTLTFGDGAGNESEGNESVTGNESDGNSS